MLSPKGLKQRSRRWWQVLLRGSVLIGVALAAAYVTLPWWVPAGFARDYLARDIQRQTGLRVKITSVSLSWSRGVEIRGLRIYNPPAFGAGPVVDVEALRADLSPVDFFVRKRLSWIEIDRPRVLVKVDEEGNVNLAALSRVSFDVQPERISIHQATAFLQLPRQEHTLRVNVSDAQVIAGRLQSLGRLTMSAALEQKGSDAPVGLQMASGPSEAATAAAAALNFANVDLQQLPLRALINPPLRKLSGRCSGLINLQINRQGVVDQFSCNLSVLQLDVQPAEGPHLPVIDQARLRISAAYDPLTGLLELQSIDAHLPGIDLAGRATAYTQAGVGWEAIKLLDLRGQFRPARLAALLTGRDRLPGGMVVDGPVGVEIDAERQGQLLSLRFALDATPAALRRNTRILKPPGRTLQVELTGNVDHRNWRFAADQGKLVLGGNKFLGHGTLHNIHTLAEHWLKADSELTLPEALADLSNLSWSGSWEISESESLRDLAGEAADALGELKLQGQLTGGWSIERREDIQLDVHCTVPAGAALVVGRHFVKPAGRAVTLALAGAIDTRRASLKDLDLDVTVGDARASFERGYVHLAGAGEDRKGMQLDAGGRFSAERVEDLLACLSASGETRRGEPACKDLAKTLRGTLEGRWVAQLGSGTRRLHVSCDLTETAIASGRSLAKPAGQRGILQANFLSDDAAGDEKNSLECRWVSPQADLSARAAFPGAQAAATGPIRLRGRANVKDVRWFLDLWPALREGLGDGRLGGSISMEGSGVWRQHTLQADVHCDADALEFVSPGDRPRIKRAGTALRVRLAGSLQSIPGQDLVADVHLAAVDVSGSHTRLSGRVVLAPARKGQQPRLYPPPNLRRFEVSADTLCVLDAPLGELFPEVAQAVRRHGLAGAARIAARVGGDGEAVSLKAHLDAGDVSAGNVQASGPPQQGKSDQRGQSPPQLVKPPGMPAQADLEVTMHPNLSRIVMNNLQARVGDVELLADAAATYSGPPGRFPTALEKKAAHVSLWTRRAENLYHLVPRLQAYQLSGDARVEAELKDTPAPEVTYARLGAENLRGRYRGKDLLLRGDVLLEGIRLHEDDVLEAARFKTECLELRAGENHGWLVADITGLPRVQLKSQVRDGQERLDLQLAGPPTKPAGTFYFQARYLDEPDLSAWLASEEAVAPTEHKLSQKEIEAHREKSRKWIAMLRPYLLSAGLSGRVRADHFRTYDAAVRQFYDAANVAAEVSFEGSRATVSYQAGLNGGLMQVRHEVDLKHKQPLVASQTLLRDVIAADNIQPQLARYFPNNTVFGFFNRDESVMTSLENFVAVTLDARFPACPVGAGKTITIDGVTKGRAAPQFVTALLPRLNLAEYRYKKMTAFAEFQADGSADNDMIFDGQTYDLYIEGATDCQNIGRYTIGLILLGAPQSADWNHTWKQGRIPILKFKARIEDMQMHDVEVSYPWPYETLRDILLQNNIVYRALLNAVGQ